MGEAAVASGAPAEEWAPSAADKPDIQGLVVSGYDKLPLAAFLLLHIPEGGAAAGQRGAWIKALFDRITDATGKQVPSLNLAFTAAGLRALGLDTTTGGSDSPGAAVDDASRRSATGFSPQFLQGMTWPDRSRFLGDEDDAAGRQAPKWWRWHGGALREGGDDGAGAGGGAWQPVHALLMLYTQTAKDLAAETETLRTLLTAHGVRILDASLQLEVYETTNKPRRDGTPVTVRREHFGFADGFSQPVLRARPPAEDSRDWHGIAVGDVLFSYPNTYDVPAPGPLVDAQQDPDALLPDAPGAAGMHDLGRNGSYLVVRQYKQDVAAFWQALDREAPAFRDEQDTPADAEWLAERCIGRTREGDMLTPDGIRPRLSAEKPGNDFGFLTLDREGYGCPIGAHVRRANPRDSLAPPDGSAEEALHSANRHRILRRGRPYGRPLADKRNDDGIERGLMFVALNTDLARQFEFIQHMWLNNTNFGGLYEEADAMLGPPGPLTIPSTPIRQRAMFARYVTVVGGEYFFLPSLRALRYLGSL